MLSKTLVPLALTLLGMLPLARADDNRQVVVDDAWHGATGIHFSGRLTEVRAVAETRHNRMRTLYKTTRGLLTSGEEGAVTWQVADWKWTVRTDDDGYWMLSTNLPVPLTPGWFEIRSEPKASSSAGLLVVDPRNRLGIISDIDDTIVRSDVTTTWLLLKNSLTVPPGRREAVPGVAALYQRLLARNPNPEASAVFYVSSSPRQLTDNLRTFLNNGGFPRGVLRLKEISEASDNSLFEQKDYKLRTLTEVLLAYPHVRFALFGDDGEQDPEIYATLQERFPTQIEGVWIRRVHPNPARAVFANQSDTAELLPTPLSTSELNSPTNK
jgi:phosphatidate phosphatase APP1